MSTIPRPKGSQSRKWVWACAVAWLVIVFGWVFLMVGCFWEPRLVTPLGALLITTMFCIFGAVAAAIAVGGILFWKLSSFPLCVRVVGFVPAILLAVLIAKGLDLYCSKEPFGSGPEHRFPVEPAPYYLTEELAIAKARETLAREGYKPSEWQLVPAQNPDKCETGDGKPDKYFQRFRGFYRGPNEGSITFVKGKVYRTYHLWIDGNCVVCSRWRGI